LQVSIFASFRPQPPVRAHPFAIYRLLTLHPDAAMLCHGLWNNTPLVVNYNRDHLGLEARLATSQIGAARAGQRRQFHVKEGDNGTPVADGDLREPTRQEARALWTLFGHLGLRGMLQGARSPFVHVPVVNPISTRLLENQIAGTYTRLDRQIIRLADPADRLTLTHPTYALLRFRPAFVQHGYGVRFVYLRPRRCA
jgi:hypothetical protein